MGVGLIESYGLIKGEALKVYDKINDKSIVVVFYGGGGDLTEGECKREKMLYLPTGP